jgi:hypothetical protein
VNTGIREIIERRRPAVDAGWPYSPPAAPSPRSVGNALDLDPEKAVGLSWQAGKRIRYPVQIQRRVESVWPPSMNRVTWRGTVETIAWLPTDNRIHPF